MVRLKKWSIKKKGLPDDKRMDFVAIVTPNHMHYEPAKLAMESGFDVICDKPLVLLWKRRMILRTR